jgi:hypothetical protein
VNIAVAISPADKIFNIVINLLHSNATNVLPHKKGADRCSGGECKTCSQALNDRRAAYGSLIRRTRERNTEALARDHLALIIHGSRKHARGLDYEATIK